MSFSAGERRAVVNRIKIVKLTVYKERAKALGGFCWSFRIPDLKVGAIATSFRTWTSFLPNNHRGLNPFRKSVNLGSIIVACLFFFMNASLGQNITFLHSVMIGSDGTDKVRAKGAEKRLEDLHEYFTESLTNRVKNKIILPFSKEQKTSLLQSVATVYGTSDSSDMVIGVWAGAWQPNPRAPELAEFVTSHSERIPAEYVVNFANFLAPHSVILFILAPQGFEFPSDVLNGYDGSTASGGKHIILVRSRERVDFDDLLSTFADVAKRMRSVETIDSNKDGWITTAEWIREFSKKAQSAKLSLVAYQLSKVPEYRIMQLKR